MDGYEVITSDDQKLGKVGRVANGYLIVEHKHLLKGKAPRDPARFRTRRGR